MVGEVQPPSGKDDMSENNNNQQMEKFRKYLFNEITFFIAVISAVIGIVLFITGPDAQLQQDVALIKQEVTNIKENHLHELKDDMEKVNSDISNNKNAINELDKKLIKIMTKLGIE